ncbi:granulin a [Pelmatolapia mariae]|uniref:granulin a n=1 Tax=Pelmatolapia mariae TaxID=158779 RepID=UPI002FE5936E
MQKWVVICWAVLAVVGADVCPDGGLCKEGETCCNSPANGYGCCRYENAECCDDHIHCCPAGTVCNKAVSGCINTTLTIPWVNRTPADQPKLFKSLRMVKAYELREDDNICPDLSRCPAEYSCLKGVTKFGCCPLTQGISCPNGKHCCPEGHNCSADSRACIKKEFVVTVLCSDGVSECPDGTTCCETTEGKWACCPLPKAVCCADKIHCCSEGTTCDVEHSKCIHSSTKKEMPMWAKLPARVRAAWENQKEVPAEAVNNTGTENAPKVTTANLLPPSGNNVKCDDTKSCPDGNTCCKTKDGSWGCCPLPEAVCCDDHETCCPSGTTCDTATGSCNGPSGSTPMLKKLPAFLTGGRPAEEKKKEKEGNNVKCDDTTSCPDGNTCCKTKDGSWGCCPLPEAVCCDDHETCCPSGTTCDTATGSCNGPSGSTPMLKKLPAFLTGGRPAEEKKKEKEGNNVKCDDTTSCPDGNTCCKTKDGSWGCCPLPEAVCCDDHETCCPSGTTCDTATGSCNGPSGSTPMLKKLPAFLTGGRPAEEKKKEKEGNNVPCDDTTSCPDGNTCCKTKDGSWGCCPLPEAVCCDDHETCCPSGTTCDTATGSCNGPSGSTPMLKKLPAFLTGGRPAEEKKKGKEGNNVPCDDTTSCPDGNTCCKTKDGSWGCCPLPEAVCCDDHETCCPSGTTCDTATGSCNGPSGSTPMLKKLPAFLTGGRPAEEKKKEKEGNNVKCDDTTSCPDGNTCCKTKDGSWGCCPLPEAVCCDDHETCCPSGTTCDTATGSCNGPSGSTPMLKKLPAFLTGGRPAEEKKKGKEGNNVPCDDTTSCPDGNTCCKTKDGSWGCCPLPEAVCCDDHETCCPSGTTCDTATGSCNGPSGSTPMLKKLPAFLTGGRPAEEKKKEKEGNNVKCDDTTSCPDGNTCCKTKDGSWGCCPLPEAVCCDDHETCCPSGTTCDTATGSCNGPSGSTPMLKKLPAFLTGAPTTVQPTTESPTTSSKPEEEEKEGEGMINCDANTSCPQSTTCCYMKNFEKWGCCPLPEAVCCEDGSHCCPDQYKCDNSCMSCIKGEVVIPWYTKIPAITSDEAEPSSVQCEGANQCPEQTTCCKLFTGEWGCCPLKNAVCCPDKEHCCPQGYTCDVLSRSCQKLIMMQLERVPLTPVYLLEPQPQLSPTTHEDIKCDDKTSCGDDETCCRTSATSWGCCPSPNAVCCSDMKHCCPTGYTCTEEGSCIQNSKLYWPNWHVFLANKKRALIV